MGENSCSKIDDFFMTVLDSSHRTDLDTPFRRPPAAAGTVCDTTRCTVAVGGETAMESRAIGPLPQGVAEARLKERLRN